MAMSDNTTPPRDTEARFGKQTSSHPLVEPRMGAAITIILGGGGLGITLMLAHKLIALGLVSALISAVAAAWIYSAHFKSAYKTLSKGEPYEGASVKELIIVLGMIFFLVIVSLVIFTEVSGESSPQLVHARIRFSGLNATYEPESKAYLLNIHFKNHGADASWTRIFPYIVLSEKPLTDDEQEIYMGMLKHVATKPESTAIGQNTTPIDMDVYVPMKAQPISLENWEKFEQGSLILTVFAVTNFSDESVPLSKYFVGEFCAQFDKTLASYMPCSTGHNGTSLH